MTETHNTPGQPGARLDRAEVRWRAITRFATVLRNTVLGHLGFALVLIVAGAGWYLSYHNLHGYAVAAMGFTPGNAWLVPVVFDGAPLGLSIVVYRARLQARAAVLWRAGIWAFAALSAYVNWIHVPATQNADLLAALLPIAAVVLFEGLMHETHKAAQLDLYGGRVVPRLTLACWILDRRRTFVTFKTKALRPLAAAEDTLGIARTEPLPSRVDVDLEAVGRALSAGSGAYTHADTGPYNDAYTQPADGVQTARTNAPSRTGVASGDVRTREPDSGRTHGRTRRRAEPDITDLIPLGQQVYSELHAAGEHLTRDRLAAEIRERGHSLGAARAHALWRALQNGHAPALD